MQGVDVRGTVRDSVPVAISRQTLDLAAREEHARRALEIANEDLLRGDGTSVQGGRLGKRECNGVSGHLLRHCSGQDGDQQAECAKGDQK
jgi:hypothetical protein